MGGGAAARPPRPGRAAPGGGAARPPDRGGARRRRARLDLARPDGAWIDAVLAEAADADGDGKLVVGHSDWSAKHFGWRGDRICVVHDWPDSLVADTEAALVGYASAIFPATWALPLARRAPSPEEAEAFVGEYERAAGVRLDRPSDEAARLRLLAYVARCELSDLDGARGDFQHALSAFVQ